MAGRHRGSTAVGRGHGPAGRRSVDLPAPGGFAGFRRGRQTPGRGRGSPQQVGRDYPVGPGPAPPSRLVTLSAPGITEIESVLVEANVSRTGRLSFFSDSRRT